MIDLHPHPEMGGKIGFERAGIRIFLLRTGRTRLRFRAGLGLFANQLFGLADRETAIDDLLGQRPGVSGGN